MKGEGVSSGCPRILSAPLWVYRARCHASAQWSPGRCSCRAAGHIVARLSTQARRGGSGSSSKRR